MKTIIESFELVYYTSASGKSYFYTWLSGLDNQAAFLVRSRLNRVRLGNFGDCKLLKNGDGVWELRLKSGPGYRIYFGKSQDVIIVLLCAGDKGSQDKDIEHAKKYWADYKESRWQLKKIPLK